MFYGYYSDLPRKLSGRELFELYRKYENGDKEAFEKIYLHHLLYVKNVIDTIFSNFEYDREELFSIGCYGLLKALKSFDVKDHKGFIFSINKGIQSEIGRFLKSEEKHQMVTSFLNFSLPSELGDIISYEKFLLSQGNNLEENFLNQETFRIISELLEKIPNELDQKVIKLYFGFNDEKLSISAIASKLKISEVYISRIIRKCLDHISSSLSFLELEIGNRKKDISEQFNGKTIYEYLGCSKEVFNLIYENLTLEEQERLLLCLNYDFDKPFQKPHISKKELDSFYRIIVKLRNYLANISFGSFQDKPITSYRSLLEQEDIVIKKVPVHSFKK